jgi:hypothetical protein
MRGNLKPGMLVLAADLDRQGKAKAWYEAAIASLEDSEIRLTWRDFPRDGELYGLPMMLSGHGSR